MELKSGHDYAKYGQFNGAQDIWGWIQNIGYGIANIWGQGETANDFINDIKHTLGRNTTLKAYELIKFVKDRYGSDLAKLQKILSLIDSKLGSLPPVLSQNIKKVVSQEKARLLSQRTKVAQDLNKVENAMNTSLNLAVQQDTLAPTAKYQNQNNLADLSQNAPTTSGDDYKDIERTLF